MEGSGTRPRAVMIGLPAVNPYAPAHMLPRVGKELAELPGLMADAGIDYEFDQVMPENIAELGPKLESQRPDVVVIGNGIRGTMELTHFMEQIIDVVRTHAPQAKLAFNTMPVNTVDAVKRWWPTAPAAK
ncbi:unnamed protein product [Calypogeia fissa]